MTLDKDLQSIQEVRNMMKRAVAAQKEFQSWNQEQVDSLSKSHRQRLYCQRGAPGQNGP